MDSRLVISDHLDARSLKRKAIRTKKIGFFAANPTYGTMIADSWQCKNELVNKMFDTNSFEKRIKLVYLDIPRLHEFNEEGERFFELLEQTDNIDLFKKESV